MKTVYYSNHLNIFIDDPEPLIQSFAKSTRNKLSEDFNVVKKCPAFKHVCENVFVVNNVVDYGLGWESDKFFSDRLDQHFFNKNVFIRSIPDGFLSFRFPFYIFWCETPLELELLPPYLHDIDLMSKTVMIPGSYDIGRHIRALEIAFFFKKPNDKVVMKKHDPMFYIKFNTKEKIKFQKFYATPEFIKLSESALNVRSAKERPEPLQFWYDIFTRNYRKKVSKMIKDNLM